MEPTSGKSPEKRHMFDDPRNVKRVIYGICLLCVISLAGQFFIHVHAEHPWEHLFGFHALYGFLSFVVLVILAKEILRRLVMRREDYYDD